MATLFSPGFLSILAPIVVFIFIFSVTWALLKKTKFFGEKDGVLAAISFVIAMLFVIIPDVMNTIQHFVPWFILLLFLTLFIFMFFIFLGVKGESLEKVTRNSTFITFAVAAIIIIFLISLTKVFGPFLLTNPQPGFWNSTKRLLFSPRTLGIIVLLLIAAFSARFITSNE